MRSRSPLLAHVIILAVAAAGIGCETKTQAVDSGGSGDDTSAKIFDALFDPDYSVTARSVGSCSPIEQSRFRSTINASVNGGSTRLLTFFDRDIMTDETVVPVIDKLIRLDSGDEICVFSTNTDEVGATSDNHMNEDQVCQTVASNATALDIDLRMEDDTTACAVEVSLHADLDVVAQGEVFHPIDAVASSSLPSPPRPPSLIIDGSELSGTGALEDQTHGNGASAEGMWHVGSYPGYPSLPPDVNIQWLRFELGVNRDLEGVYVWNQNQQGQTQRGVKSVRIRVSNSTDPGAIVWTTIGDFELDQACDCATETSQFVKFDAADVKWVRFEVISAWSGLAREWVGLSEVAFVGDPTPAP